MQDTLARQIEVDDTIIVARTKGTNTSLVIGKVDRVHENSVDYIVLHPGSYFGTVAYGSSKLETGDIAYATVSHRVLIMEKA